MTLVRRPVDSAMLEQRREKNTVRTLWLERAKYYAGDPDVSPDHVLYFTLPGAAAAEVEMLIESGLITLTETGAIAPESAHRLVCLELDHQVYLDIQTKYSGLKIIRNGLGDLLHGSGRIRFPGGDVKKFCRARVVNLDLNEAWIAREDNGEPYVQVLRWIQKFGEMHAEPPPAKWTLLLTLHGECPWNQHQANLMRGVLLNAIQSANIREEISQWLGESLLANIEAGTIQNYKSLTRERQQKLLMWLVPAMIAEHCTPQGWVLDVRHNLRYGTPPHAPMATWIIDFQRPENQQLTWQIQYRDSLSGILRNAGQILTDGNIQKDSHTGHA